MNTYHRIVMTAGISLFAAQNVYGKQARELEEIFKFDRSNPLPADGLDEKAALQKWEAHCKNLTHQPIPPDRLKDVSAEFSLLHALQSQKRLGDKPTVVLIHTATLGGMASVRLLEYLLPRYFGVEVQSRQVDDFNVNNRDLLRQSLGHFMNEVASALEGSDPSFTCFAPVGGYKVMTSLGYLAGAYMGFPTAYLHEDGQVLHEIAAVPLQIEQADLRDMAGLMLRANSGEGLSWPELSAEEQRKIERHSYLFERAGDWLFTNAFSAFLMQRHRDLFSLSLRLSPDALKDIADQRQRDFAATQVRGLWNKLGNPQAYRGELHHESDFQNLRQENRRFSLYKGASNGDLVFRAAYLWDEPARVLYINRIWTTKNNYPQEPENGIGFFDDPASIHWQDWTSE